MYGQYFVERFWRSVKYENVYIRDYRTYGEAHAGITEYMTFFNTIRPHESLQYKTPREVHFFLPDREKQGHRIAQEQRNVSETTQWSSQKSINDHFETRAEKYHPLLEEIAVNTSRSNRPTLTPSSLEIHS